MPLYTYECDVCSLRAELFRPIKNRNRGGRCVQRECQGKMRRVIEWPVARAVVYANDRNTSGNDAEHQFGGPRDKARQLKERNLVEIQGRSDVDAVLQAEKAAKIEARRRRKAKVKAGVDRFLTEIGSDTAQKLAILESQSTPPSPEVIERQLKKEKAAAASESAPEPKKVVPWTRTRKQTQSQRASQ